MAKLAAYQAKRDFAKTAEPRGEDAPGTGDAFVIQKHDATRLHYDLRLEFEGVMKSWAVAKGPSLLPGEKRLAIHTEDHPVAYNAFEGTIPKGQYGGGAVMIWDRGTWAPDGDPHRGYAKGHIDFTLTGEKLGGRWHLVRLRSKAGEKQEAWLLIKADDEAARSPDAPDILEEAPRSVVSGRTIEEIAAATDGAVWHSAGDPAAAAALPRPPDAPKPGKTRRSRKVGAEAPATARHPMPQTVEPCLATLGADVPKGELWLHEIKWDGYRLLAHRKGKATRLLTRRGLDWTARFPSIRDAVAALPVESVILDGEAVVEDERGIASFSALQAALSDEGGRIARDAVLFAFDLLFLDGEDLRPLPLDARKARLAGLLAGATGALRLSEHIDGDGTAVARNACRLGLEGVISKRRDKPYRSGRGDDWIKVKCTERQEFVIGGFVPSGTGRKAIGSLLLGYNEDGRLVHAGRSGTGFTAESARDLWKALEPTRRKLSPFAGKLTADERRGAEFVEPALVAEIEFRGWTGDGRLRHAAFKGLREDKVASEVVREAPVGAADTGPKRRKPARSGPGRGADEVAGVRLTHPDRVLWDDGLTKRGLAEFYEGIADWLLPQVADRPLSLVRCPNGAGGGCFFQKHSWAGLSEHIRRDTVRDEDGEEEVLYVENIAGIVGLVQAGVLEIHPWGSRVGDVDRADRITMDLDPGDGVAWTDVIAAARDVRERLRAMGLESFVKTTGGKGLHVVVPLAPRPDWGTTKSFAHALALAMEKDKPDRYLARATKSARRGLIYVDYLRNGRGATAVAAYSTRARARPTVSVPLGWDELDPALGPDHFTVSTLPARLASLRRDPWDGIDSVQQTVPDGPGTVARTGNRRVKPALARTKSSGRG